MADVKKINGYAIKDEFARQIANIANNKFLIDDSLYNVYFHWIGESGQQRLEIFITFIDTNTKLMIQFTYAGELNFFVTNDNGATWSLIWTK